MLNELAVAVDALCGAEPAALADGETMEELHRELARLSAVVTRAAAAFDARPVVGARREPSGRRA